MWSRKSKGVKVKQGQCKVVMPTVEEQCCENQAEEHPNCVDNNEGFLEEGEKLETFSL